MKNKENFNPTDDKGSGLTADKIKKWAADIANAKGAQKLELRKAFKDEYKVNFSQKLVDETIAGESQPESQPVSEISSEAETTASPEIFSTVKSQVVEKIIELDKFVADQKAGESKEMEEIKDPKVIKEASEIDEKRDVVVATGEEAMEAVAQKNLDDTNKGGKEEAEADKLEEELNNLMVHFADNRKKFSVKGISKEEKKELQKEKKNLELSMAFIVEKQRAIKGKTDDEKIVEPEVITSAVSDGTPELTPELIPEVDAEPTAEIEVEPVAGPISEPFTEPVVESETVQTGEPAPEVVIEPKPEEQKDDVLEKFKEFNIGEEEIKTLKGFSDLTPAQQFLVYEGLKQMSLVEVKEGAKNAVDAKIQSKIKIVTSDMGFWRRNSTKVVNAFNGIIPGLTKKYDIAKKEKEGIRNLKTGGLPLQKNNIAELTNMISAMKIDATLDQGKIKVNYLPNRESLNAEQNSSLNNFNDIAYKFSQIPKDWAFKTANKKQQEEYRSQETQYFRAKADALEVLGKDPSGGDALFEMNKADYQVKLMQFLAAHPDIDKEFSKIENQSALRKMMSGEAAARGSYMAGGFAARHTLTGLIGLGGLPVAAASFVAMPLAAAGVGAWRARDRAKTGLNEKDITGRKTNVEAQKTNIEMQRLQVVDEINKLVPLEYNRSINIREEWLKTTATKEQRNKFGALKAKYDEIKKVYDKQNEKERDKTVKHFYLADDFTNKLQISEFATQTKLNESIQGAELSDPKKGFELYEDYKTALYNLKVRIQYTEEKLESGLVNFGSGNSLKSKLDLVQALSEARTTLILNYKDLEDKEKELKGEEATRKEQKLKDDTSRDLEKRFNDLFASKYFKFNQSLSEARKKYIKKEMIKGAGIGATFAIGGMLLRELAGQFGIIKGPHIGDKVGGQAPEKMAGNPKNYDEMSRRAARALTGEANNEKYEPIGQSPVEDASTNNAEIFSDKISNEGLNGRSDSAWRSIREIFKKNADKFGYRGDASDAESLHKWAETQTANAVHNSPDVAKRVVFEGNHVLLERGSNGNFFAKVEAGEGPEPGFLNDASNTPEVVTSATETPTGNIEPKELDAEKFFAEHPEANEQIKKFGWTTKGTELHYGSNKNSIVFTDDAKDITISGDGGDGTKIIVNDKDGSIHEIVKVKGEFREVDIKTGEVIQNEVEVALQTNEIVTDKIITDLGLDPDKFSYGGEEGLLKTNMDGHEIVIDTKNNFLKYSGEHGIWAQIGAIINKENISFHLNQFNANLVRSEELLQNNGFSIQDLVKGNLRDIDNLYMNISGRDVILDFSGPKTLVTYSWENEELSFSFQPGEATKSNIESFLTEQTGLEKSASSIQENLMNGDVKNFASLKTQLEQLYGTKFGELKASEKTIWRDLYNDNFAKKTASSLGETERQAFKEVVKGFFYRRIGAE